MHQEVEEIRRKSLNNPWPKFLESVQIAGLRGWRDTEVRFQFPVTVVAGENGSGKSTLLKAAASAYINPDDPSKTFYPSSFFPDTAWDSVRNATLRFKIREGTSIRELTFHKGERWRFPKNRAKRHVFWQDISRTVPINAIVGYAYIAKRTALETSAVPFDADSTKYFSSIMGRSYQSIRFAQTNIDPRRHVGVVSQSGIQYSQFHQGAGEDATLDLLSVLQVAPDTSLILIDEVEASLHPRAQRRLVHYLLWLCRIKQIQVILSTHSSTIIDEIPPEGRIFLEPTSGGMQVIYGVTSKFALGRMDDYSPPELYLFTEDSQSSVLVKAILRKQSVDLTRISVVEVGPANVVAAVSLAMSRRTAPIPATGVLDPEQAPSTNCVNIPGQHAPEIQVINDILTIAVNQLASRLEIPETTLQRALSNAVTIPDHHLWLEVIANGLGLSKEYLWETCANVWAHHCLTSTSAEDFARRATTRLQRI